MELDEVVYSRRSIRKYKANKTISNEVVEQIISYALEAPSWKNTETGRYYVALSKDARDNVVSSLPEFNVNNTVNACAYIIACYKKGIAGFKLDGSTTNGLGDKWGTYDLGLQNSLILLKARELGLDTLIMGMRDENKLKSYFSIPDDEEIVSVISLGYRDIEPVKVKRKELNEILKIY